MDADLLFSINPGSPEPIYRQLVEQLRRRVASGQLVAGQEIPRCASWRRRWPSIR